ncbi:YidC/Oxa1 family membrane protein insertase [Streptomyces antarcticus]|uniref:YidC/Oxa1 family membrane protein insertase n=1 Tax=Streptomyces antarcticus TaxID=2996458 RepID=UPI002271D6A1|nr:MULTISPECIES: YidC/Oxa1 family membrane protein insertase [unclassified Streptomyces]MCY0947144.1 YidC/Oxa1 family membrane protein insertase [Streptomyces sp. H34-AA3]MCZ4086198.1 YidC/Oxa1 family membrane protein insertase [Streptomyces sp. H34-S5]
MSAFTHLVAQLGRLLEPVLAQSATAAAIVLFTVLVRLALYPLSRAAFRGATPLATCLPMLLQLPVFFVMYQAFSAAEVGGAANELLGQRLFEAPLGARWSGALGEGGLLGAQGLVFLGLFAAIAAVAAWSAVRGRRAAAAIGSTASASATAAPGAKAGAKAGAKPGGTRPGGTKAAGAKGGTGAGTKAGARSARSARGAAGAGRPAEMTAEQQELMRKLGGVLPLLSFGTLITAAVVPLAAGLYLLTTTAWSVAERVWLQHRKDREDRAERAASAGAAGASGAAGVVAEPRTRGGARSTL